MYDKEMFENLDKLKTVLKELGKIGEDYHPFSAIESKLRKKINQSIVLMDKQKELVKLFKTRTKYKKCSVCEERATKEIQVIWRGKEKFFPRCDKHVVGKYLGIVRPLAIRTRKNKWLKQ